MNGHPQDQAKVSPHDKWPLVGGTGGRRQPHPLYDYIHHHAPAIFVLNTMSCIVIIMYAIVIEPTINASS